MTTQRQGEQDVRSPCGLLSRQTQKGEGAAENVCGQSARMAIDGLVGDEIGDQPEVDIRTCRLGDDTHTGNFDEAEQRFRSGKLDAPVDRVGDHPVVGDELCSHRRNRATAQ